MWIKRTRKGRREKMVEREEGIHKEREERERRTDKNREKVRRERE